MTRPILPLLPALLLPGLFRLPAQPDRRTADQGPEHSWKGIGGHGSQMAYEYRYNCRNWLYRYAGLDGSGVLMKWHNLDEKVKTIPSGGYAGCRLCPQKD